MRANALDATAGDLAQAVPPVRADESLEQALDRLMTRDAVGLAVLDREDGQVVGWLTHRDLLAAYSGRLGAVRTVAWPRPPNQGQAGRRPRPPG